MRETIHRSIAFVVGFLAASYVFEVAMKWFTPYPWASFHVFGLLQALAVVTVLVLPGAIFGFFLASRHRTSFPQATLLGALYWSLGVVILYNYPNPGLGAVSGAVFIFGGAALVALLGGSALARREAYG